MTFYVICALLFVFSATFCWAAGPLCARLARRWGLVDHPGERKIHATAVPYGGGIAILMAVGVTVAIAYLTLALGFDALPAAWREFIRPHLSGLTEAATIRKLAGMLGGAAGVFVLGLVDDFRPLPPRLKLLAQVLAASAAWLGGVRVLPLFDSQLLSYFLTVGWVVVVTNAFNLLDNMDGLSAGVALAACGALFGVMSGEYYFTAAMISVFAGALAGFLPRNFARPEKKMFMGDAGALFAGFVLATLTIAGNYYADRGPTHALLMPVILLGVPLFDTVSVIVIRLRLGRPVMVGDTNHLSHRLTRRGFTRHQAVGIIWLLSVICGLLAQLLAQLDTTRAIITFAAALSVVLLMAALMFSPAPQGTPPLQNAPDATPPAPASGAAPNCGANGDAPLSPPRA